MAEPKLPKTTPNKPTQKVFSISARRPPAISEDVRRMDMKAVKQHIKDEIGDYHHANIDLKQFAIHVWGISMEDIKRLKNANYKSTPAKKVKEYGILTPESRLHKPFRDFLSKLLKEAMKELGDPTVKDTLTKAIWDSLGGEALVQEGRERKPDNLCLYDGIPTEATPSWAAVRFIFEFKNKSTVKGTVPKDANLQGRGGLRSGPPAAMAASEGSQGTKRKRGNTQDSVSRKKHNKSGRRDPEEFSDKFQQMAAYGIEAFAATSRFWMIGVVIDKFIVTVCYLDRFHVLRASSFHFAEEPWKLALVAYGLNISNHRQIGIDPHLRALPSIATEPSDTTEASSDNEPDSAPPVLEIVGSYFEFPPFFLEPTRLTPEHESPEELQSANPQREGTSSSRAWSPESAVPVVFRIDEVLRRSDDLIGRGTTVHKVRLQLPDGSYEVEPYVLKNSWPIRNRTSEVDIVKELKTLLPKEAHKYLPEFFFSSTSSAQDLRLPWLSMGLSLTAKNFQDRVFRRIVSRFYVPLWQSGGIEEFKKVFLDCVQIHYLAYKKGILHRDISERNLMATSGAVRGILNDWDMAKFIHVLNDMLTAAHHRTASSPFLALDRLSKGASDISHWYRHDLESFFYVLIWAAVHYDLTKGTRDELVNVVLVPWTQRDNSNWNNKITIVGTLEPLELDDQIKEEFKPLLDQWIKPLRKFFFFARSNYNNQDGKGFKHPEYETYSGGVTFRGFMAAVNCTEENIADWAIVPDILDI